MATMTVHDQGRTVREPVLAVEREDPDRLAALSHGVRRQKGVHLVR
jgi:hypothetical protein